MSLCFVVTVVDKSLPSMQQDTATTPLLPSVHTEPHIGRRCVLLHAASFSFDSLRRRPASIVLILKSFKQSQVRNSTALVLI